MPKEQLQFTFDTDADTAFTVASMHKDFVDWRKGRSRYAIWAMDVDTPSLCTATTRIRQHLEDYLLPGYDRQPHITLSICGFPAHTCRFDDDYTPAIFRKQINCLELARIRPFTIEIGAPETFTSAAYFSVRDDEGGIARVRQALGNGGPGEQGFTYIPHLSFGHYRGQFSVAEVTQRLRSCPDLPCDQLNIRRLVLMTYDASVISGTLTSLCEFDLERHALQVLNVKAMEVLLR